ncbi:hypothetical protein ScPMuIL_013395 [Solemya velum]
MWVCRHAFSFREHQEEHRDWDFEFAWGYSVLTTKSRNLDYFSWEMLTIFLLMSVGVGSVLSATCNDLSRQSITLNNTVGNDQPFGQVVSAPARQLGGRVFRQCGELLPTVPVRTVVADLDNLISLECNKDILRLENGTIVLNIEPRNPCVPREEGISGCTMKCRDTNGDEIKLPFPTVRFTPVSRNGSSFRKTDYNTSMEELQTMTYKFNKDEVVNTDCFSLFPEFKLSNISSYFSINDDGIVTNKEQLIYNDARDGTNLYTLNVAAKYPDEDNFTAHTTLTVEVKDVPNRDPRFTENEYTLHVQENEILASLGWQTTDPPIKATDGDTGINATIMYSLQDSKNVFHINSMNGTVLVNGTFDYETGPKSYTLVVLATENTTQHSTATAKLIIMVDDVDDHQPYFKCRHYNGSIVEHAQLETEVLIVQATDDDSQASNRNFTFDLVGARGLFSVGDDGKIKVSNSTALGRETIPSITFTVEVRNVNSLEPADNTTVTITLKDINDHQPIFKKNNYRFHANSTTKGTFVGQIEAEDEDTGMNGNITYTLESIVNTRLPFSVNPTTGVIIMETVVSSVREYTFIARACDQNPVERCSWVPVVVDFLGNGSLSRHLNFSVAENSPIGAVVGELGTACKSCTIQGAPFKCSSGGLLLTASDLDYEDRQNYTFSFYPSECSTESPDNLTVTVTVTDVNDNAPAFSKLEYQFFPQENMTAGTVLGTIQATDNDSEDNGRVTYSLLNSSTASLFELNPTNGKFTIRASALPTSNPVFEVTAIAQDQGSPALKSITKIYVSNIVIRNDMVDLIVPAGRETILNRKEELERSHMLLSAELVTAEELRESLWKNWSEIQSLFANETMASQSTAAPTLTSLEIALLVLSVLFLAGLVGCMIMLYHQRRRNSDYKRLYESLTRRSSIYTEQELALNIEDETSDYTGSLTTQEIETEGKKLTGANQADHISITDLTKTEVTEPLQNTTQKTSVASNKTLEPTTSTEDINEVISQLEELSQLDDNETESNVVTGYDKLNLLKESSLYENLVMENPAYMNVPMNTSPLDGENTEEKQPVVYANVPSDTSHLDGIVIEELQPVTENGADDYENVSKKSMTMPNSMDTPGKGELDVDSNGVKDAEREPDNALNNSEQTKEEPLPDYDMKQVRFSTEVLHTDENKIEPLNQDPVDDQTVLSASAALAAAISSPESTSQEEDDFMDSHTMDEADRVDEEINSPIDILKVDEKDGSGVVFNFMEEVTAL